MTTNQTPPAVEHPPGCHVHFTEVEWPAPRPPFANLAVAFQSLDTIGDHATQAAQLRPREDDLPPMADERYSRGRADWLFYLPDLLLAVAIIVGAVSLVVAVLVQKACP